MINAFMKTLLSGSNVREVTFKRFQSGVLHAKDALKVSYFPRDPSNNGR